MSPRSLLPAAVSVAAALLAVSFGGCGLDASGALENPPGSPCVNDAQCSRSPDPCSVTRCGAIGLCEVIQVPDGDAPAQASADCQRNVCEGGLLKVEPDDADILDDGEDCTVDTCVEGSPRNTAEPPGTPCNVGDAAGMCNQQAQCMVACSSEGPPCDDGKPCTADSCDVAAGLCLFTLMDGIPPPDGAQIPGDCGFLICVGGMPVTTVDDSDALPDRAGNCGTPACVGGEGTFIPDPLDIPADALCSKGGCNGATPTQDPVVPGTPCGSLYCDAEGQCVNCGIPANCGQDTFCKTYTCENAVCGETYTDAHTKLPDPFQTDPDCTKLVCDGNGGVIAENDEADPVDDFNPCTINGCDEMDPDYTNEMTGTPCGPGVCDEGTCYECLDNTQCTLPNTCGGGGISYICGCAPLSCATLGKNCGMVADGCGGVIPSCGLCIGFDTCGGGNTPNVCGCTETMTGPEICAAEGANCGFVTGDCGLVGCGACVLPDSCGGGGFMNVCGCTPNNPCLDKDCGTAVNSCGDMVTCGPSICPGTQTCTNNVCN